MSISPGGAERTAPAADSSAAGNEIGGIIVPLVLAQFLCSFAGTHDERGHQQHCHRSGHDRQRSPDRHHRFHPHDGRVDDPWQQADRHLGTQVLLPARPAGLRRWAH